MSNITPNERCIAKLAYEIKTRVENKLSPDNFAKFRLGWRFFNIIVMEFPPNHITRREILDFQEEICKCINETLSNIQKTCDVPINIGWRASILSEDEQIELTIHIRKLSDPAKKIPPVQIGEIHNEIIVANS
jgi:CRISPR/Cas system CSM-associated protein Csm5 (group 7 of RAMP superfamily)